VSSRLKASPSCSKLITAEETEMPRSRLTAIQSERARRSPYCAWGSGGRWIRRRPGSTIHNEPSGDWVRSTRRSSRTRSRRAEWLVRGPISNLTMPALAAGGWRSTWPTPGL
jgi:hypothetical protein